jgi:enoyl-CoA hydratase/carnithine racemase
MSERVTLARDGAVAFIEFRRPERHNALDVATAEAFLARCRELERENGVRAVVLAGRGSSFGVGGDLAELRAGAGARWRPVPSWTVTRVAPCWPTMP